MFCKNCGAELNEKQVICLKCGVNVGDGESFCENCGKPVNAKASVCLSCGVAINNGGVIKLSTAKSVNCNGNLFQCYFNAIKNYFNFNGRTSRREYWLFILCNVIITLVLNIVFVGMVSFNTFSYLGSIGRLVLIYYLFLIIPNLSITTRRLHDINKSGWWQLLTLTCFGIIPVLIWLCSVGDEGQNNYGYK